MNDKKTTTHWGIKLTGMEMMGFSKYINNNNIAPNTMEEEERINLLKDWLKIKRPDSCS